MKRVFLLIMTFFITGFICAQTSAIDTARLKAYVGKEGVDTMTADDFLNYGKIELNDPKLQIRSYTLTLLGISCTECEMSYEQFNSNMLKRDWISKTLNDMNVKLLQATIGDLRLFDSAGHDITSKKEFTFILKYQTKNP